MADLSTTQTMADGLSKQGLYYLCALSWTVSLALFLWLMRVSRLRIDDRDRAQARYDALFERMAVHMDRSTEATSLLLAKGQRAPGARTRAGDAPGLGLEPISQVKKPPGVP